LAIWVAAYAASYIPADMFDTAATVATAVPMAIWAWHCSCRRSGRYYFRGEHWGLEVRIWNSPRSDDETNRLVSHLVDVAKAGLTSVNSWQPFASPATSPLSSVPFTAAQTTIAPLPSPPAAGPTTTASHPEKAKKKVKACHYCRKPATWRLGVLVNGPTGSTVVHYGACDACKPSIMCETAEPLTRSKTLEAVAAS